MTKGKKHKSKKYEQYYGESYKPKNHYIFQENREPKKVKTVKVCSVCGKEMLEKWQNRICPYCDGSIITKVLVEKA
jgi:rubrerythrin